MSSSKNSDPYEELLAERWYHSIALPDGSCTPGVFDTRAAARRLVWPSGLQGGRCLDVGTCDGFWAFEMERNGAAEVVAIDVDNADQLDLPWEVRRNGVAEFQTSGARRKHRFELAARALGSRARRLPCSVYDLAPTVHGTFDVVFCGTVFIHLRDPVRALERMREVCRGELVLIECVDTVLDLTSRDTPAARLVPAPMQWWRSNTSGLITLLGLSGFEVVWTSKHFLTPHGAGSSFANAKRNRLARAKAWAMTTLASSTSPFVVKLLGLASGTCDVAIRARPRTAAHT